MTNRTFFRKTRLPVSQEKAFLWHSRPGALERMCPPWDAFKVLERKGGILPGAKVVMRLYAGPLPYTWEAEHTDYEEFSMFRDIQKRGPFRKWIHTHRFIPVDDHSTILEDEIRYSLPFPPFGGLFGDHLVKKKLDAIFRFRHHTLKQDLLVHERAASSGTKTFLVSGASGVIARSLIPFLTTGGHRVLKLVRNKSTSGPDTVYWNPENGEMETGKLRDITGIIHLAGENIGEGRWTKEKRQRIVKSRVMGTRLLAETAKSLFPAPEVFLSASAIGYYGERKDCILAEEDQCGDDFVSLVCDEWEKAASPLADADIRTVFARIGVVLTPAGGALAKMLPVFRAGLGGRIGKGDQYLSWISMDDVVYAIHHALFQKEAEGPVNLVSPYPVTNLEFAETLGRVLRRPAVFPVPEIAIRAAFGRMGEETVLASTRVSPEKLLQTGFSFAHPDLSQALNHVLGKAEAFPEEM